MVRETSVKTHVELYQRLKKRALGEALLNTQHYKVRNKSKVEQSNVVVFADALILKQMSKNSFIIRGFWVSYSTSPAHRRRSECFYTYPGN